MMISNKPLPEWLRKARERITADYFRDPKGFLDRMDKRAEEARKKGLLGPKRHVIERTAKTRK